MSEHEIWMWESSASLVIIKIMRLDGITHRENMGLEGHVSQHSGEHDLEEEGAERRNQSQNRKVSAGETGREPRHISYESR